MRRIGIVGLCLGMMFPTTLVAAASASAPAKATERGLCEKLKPKEDSYKATVRSRRKRRHIGEGMYGEDLCLDLAGPGVWDNPPGWPSFFEPPTYTGPEGRYDLRTPSYELTSASSPEFPASYKGTGKIMFGAAPLRVSCETVVEGEYSASSGAGTEEIRFEACKLTGTGYPKTLCSNDVTLFDQGGLGLIFLPPEAPDTVGESLTPLGGGFAKFTCGAYTVEVEGAVIAGMGTVQGRRIVGTKTEEFDQVFHRGQGGPEGEWAYNQAPGQFVVSRTDAPLEVTCVFTDGGEVVPVTETCALTGRNKLTNDAELEIKEVP